MPEPAPPRKIPLGPPSSPWHHSPTTGFDLTRASPSRLTIETTTTPLTLSPTTTALLIIDMQNFFLSPALGHPPPSPGHAACAQLVQHAVPAARRAGIRVVWVNWGLTEGEVRDMPAGVGRAFGFRAEGAEGVDGVRFDKHGREGRGGGLGREMGAVEVGGETVDAGRALMRGSWNAGLYGPLGEVFEAGRARAVRPDVWVHKNRMSALWGATTELQGLLESEGITTLLFAGVNTDQCVGGTLTDAFSKGYDCVLLSDGCGTSSPGFAQECWEYNAAHTFGFCTSCEKFADAVEKMGK
ncbi:Isochorismatase-like protein [Boeremia exigua]|uniref:Isochorismatase-like protein n=1 Tax=Boeremia exigua TaxID=749465 RepID=UPI001E8CB3E9|nr:Isochorismatase-like protein [Boeremia exigua]KAH6625594.1 Isochorismatase-like protein [Boeremia exigua]